MDYLKIKDLKTLEAAQKKLSKQIVRKGKEVETCQEEKNTNSRQKPCLCRL